MNAETAATLFEAMMGPKFNQNVLYAAWANRRRVFKEIVFIERECCLGRDQIVYGLPNDKMVHCYGCC